MSEIILTRRFRGQPQYAAPIDRAGLGKGVQFLFNPAVGPVDLVTGRVWIPGGGAAVSIGSNGKSFAYASAGDYHGYTGYPELTSNVGTFFMWCPIVGAPDTNGHVYFAASSPNVCGHQVNQNGSIIIGTGTSASSGALSSWFNTANRSLVLVSDGTAAGCKAFVDGVDTGFFWSNPPTSWGAGSKNFNLGRYVGASGFQFYGSMLCAGNTGAVWGAAEAKAFHDSKGKALYKAPARRLWAVSASGITLVGASSTEANTSSTAAITQAHALTGANSTQANTSSTAAITQAQALAGANSTQANTASTGPISQAHALVGTNSAQANASATGAVTQAHILAGANCSQGNAASTGSIAGGANLTAASCAQANASSAGSISQTHVLATDGSSQANAASTAAISQGAVHDLTAAASSQVNTGAFGAISQAHILVCPASVQDSIAAASAIVQAHVLTGAPGLQLNTGGSGAIIIGSAEVVSVVEKTAIFRATVSRTTKFRRSKSVTVRFN